MSYPSYPVSLVQTTDGTIWAGTDGDGLWRSNDVVKAWVKDRNYEKVGGDCAFCLYEDSFGRLWAGSLTEGPCVYDGKTWCAFPLETGFCGSRVFAISGDGDGMVWIASDGGLARYSGKTDVWRFWTRADGLPENEITSIACGRDGRVYLGHATAGISIGCREDDYSQWKVVSAPWTFKGGKYEVTPSEIGQGLPSNLMNSLYVHEDGTMFAGTISGLAISGDKGDTWSYIRAKDYYKYLGLADNSALIRKGERLLPDDYVTSFCPLGKESVLISCREGGICAYDIRRRTIVQLPGDSERQWITSSVRTRDGSVLLGLYGKGIVRAETEGKPCKRSSPSGTGEPPRFPRPPLEATERGGKGLQSRKNDSPSAFYLRDDWETKGDWWGRYGLRYAVLCAVYAQWGDSICVDGPWGRYLVSGWIGPNHRKIEGMRRWLHWLVTDNPNTLWLPEHGIRRQAEWDDHGETYGRYFNGPDLTVKVHVPAGGNDVAFYFFNKDGREGQNRRRDYLIELSRVGEKESPIIARARVKDFWNGVYKVFRANEEGDYLFRIRRQGSFAAILSGVFVQGAQEPRESVVEPFMNTALYMGGVVYQAPLPTFNGNPHSKLAKACTNGVERLEKSSSGKKFDRTRFGMTRTYAACTTRMDAETNEHMRWKLRRWLPKDRSEYHRYMMLCWTGAQIKNWPLKLWEKAKCSKNTVDSLEDLKKVPRDSFTLESWIDLVPPERREYVAEPSPGFWRRAALTAYNFRPPLSTSSQTVPKAQDFARTCEHRTNGTSSVRVSVSPKPKRSNDNVLGSLKPPREFSNLPTDIQKNICTKLAQCLVREDIYCGVVQILPEYLVTNSWPGISYPEKDFRFMKNLGFRPTRLIRTLFAETNLTRAMDKRKPVYFQLRNPTYNQIIADQRLEGKWMKYSPSVISFSRKCIFAFFERLKTHEWDSEDAFIEESICLMNMKDWPPSVQKLWQTSAYGMMPSCVFAVNERYGLPPPTVQLSKGMRKIMDSFYRSARSEDNLHPLIELSDREATEIVYLTALCRGKVKSLDEFNAAFVPRGETFLVKLTAEECETEIGRMLYKTAMKRGLVKERKGKEK